MQDIVAIFILALSNLFGNVGRLSLPFIQKKKDQEAELRELEAIPESQLTQEQKDRIAALIAPIHWRRHYTFTAIYGIIGSMGVTVGSIAALIALIPQDLTWAAIGLAAGGAFLQGWGGNDFANQLIKSGTTKAKSLASKIQMAAAISDIVRTPRASATTTTTTEDKPL